MQKRIGVVTEVRVLEVGTEVDMDAWQISGVSNDGKIVLASLDVPDDEDGAGYEIQKGAWRISPKNGLERINYKDKKYYPTDAYMEITKRFNNFKNTLDVYDFFEEPVKKRSVLLGSIPGVGKSAMISEFCKQVIKSDPDACILSIDSNEVDFEVVQCMFKKAKLGTVSFIVLIVEDIGGSSLNERGSSVDSTLLNFLSGQEGVFNIPTLIVGTTNFLDELASTLTDRPDRFDVVIQVDTPKDTECIDFLENFMKREMTDSEKDSIKGKGFTLAYLRECAVRQRLDCITFEESVAEIAKQRDKSRQKKHQSGGSRVGFFDED